MLIYEISFFILTIVIWPRNSYLNTLSIIFLVSEVLPIILYNSFLKTVENTSGLAMAQESDDVGVTTFHTNTGLPYIKQH